MENKKIARKCIGRKLNRPWRSDKFGKKRQVCARDSETGDIKHIYYGATGYSDFTKHKDPARRRSFRARHRCDPVSKLNKGTAQYWACEDLW
jgi:hypothetical protein